MQYLTTLGLEFIELSINSSGGNKTYSTLRKLTDVGGTTRLEEKGETWVIGEGEQGRKRIAGALTSNTSSRPGRAGPSTVARLVTSMRNTFKALRGESLELYFAELVLPYRSQMICSHFSLGS